MCQFIETIKLKDAELYRLEYHQARVDKTFGHFFPHNKPLVLAELLMQQINLYKSGTFKCRLVYDATNFQLEYLPYTRKEIRSLKIVAMEMESSAFKIENRSKFNEAFAQRENCDDVLITVNGLITDSSYANIALFDGEKWYTPKSPLLYGTNRAKLLSENKIIEKDIKASDILDFKKICLFNAMIEFNELVLDMQVSDSIVF